MHASCNNVVVLGNDLRGATTTIFSGPTINQTSVIVRDNLGYVTEAKGTASGVPNISGDLTIDHVVPKSRGGPDTWENLVAACVPCNNRKGNRTPEEAQMKLARRPFRPSHVMYMRDFIGQGEDAWKPFLFAA